MGQSSIITRHPGAGWQGRHDHCALSQRRPGPETRSTGQNPPACRFHSSSPHLAWMGSSSRSGHVWKPAPPDGICGPDGTSRGTAVGRCQRATSCQPARCPLGRGHTVPRICRLRCLLISLLLRSSCVQGPGGGRPHSRIPWLCQRPGERPPPGAGTRPVSTCFLGTHHEPSSGPGMGVWEAGLVGGAEGGVTWPGGRSWALGVLSLGPGLSEDLECVVRTVGTTLYSGLGTQHQRGSEPGFRERLPPPTPPHHHSSPSMAGQHQGSAGSQAAGRAGTSGWVSWGGAGGGGVGRAKRRWGQCGPADAACQGGALHGAECLEPRR